jgi:hypothetical protein
MFMKSIHRASFALLWGVVVLIYPSGAALSAQPPSNPPEGEAAIALVRDVLAADRERTVAEALQLTDSEAGKFWPLYDQYRARMDRTGDRLVELVRRYAFHYPNVPEDAAHSMLKELINLEKRQVETRATYLKKFGRILPASKTLRFAQVENRLDLAVRLQLAAGIPLTPVEGRLEPNSMSAVAVREGVVGGAAVQTTELTATVTSIDWSNRRVTLMSDAGIKETVRVDPDVVNFDQVRVGDRVTLVATEELVVRLASPGDAADTSVGGVVALAPVGAKPGGVAAGTVQVLGTITALDTVHRTATLRFEDGTTRTFPVREDIDLARRKIGDKVVFEVTEMIAVSVEKP